MDIEIKASLCYNKVNYFGYSEGNIVMSDEYIIDRTTYKKIKAMDKGH